LSVLLAGTGCGVDGGAWDHVEIVEAWLDRFDLSALAVVGGTLQGDALLVFTEPDGNASSLPVHLGGGLFGAAVDFSADPEGHEGSVDIDLSAVDDPTVGDVFGTYHGTGMAGAAMIGGSRRKMRNGHGASFREDHFVLGLALDASYQWVTIREGGNDGASTYDGLLPTFTGPDDSEDTGPSPDPDTGAQDDTAAPAEASSGCNEGTEPEPEPPASSGGGGGCESDSGCACSTGGTAAPLGLTGALLLLRLRRAGSAASTPSSRGRSAAR
jgi:MYXO-CTERM domain-containing protein